MTISKLQKTLWEVIDILEEMQCILGQGVYRNKKRGNINKAAEFNKQIEKLNQLLKNDLELLNAVRHSIDIPTKALTKDAAKLKALKKYL